MFDRKNNGKTLLLRDPCVIVLFLSFQNEDFWKPILLKSENFFNNCMIPETEYPRIKYGNARLNLSDKLQ